MIMRYMKPLFAGKKLCKSVTAWVNVIPANVNGGQKTAIFQFIGFSCFVRKYMLKVHFVDTISSFFGTGNIVI